ncbi:hypothetical protein DYI22_06115 [Marinobacter lipolyticus]|uniref:hypothetical protein n=1 Tax=Marinobacter lipolyticus TaxID=209639 RepID=UPI001BCB2D12|nr:hypothetical protein [Marinobacter lipolyticus]MBS8240076.1 hypothetical protein [Marinobacter lipolyticus]
MTPRWIILFTALMAASFLLGACSSSSPSTSITNVRSGGDSAREFSDTLVVAASPNARVRTVVGQAMANRLNEQGNAATFLNSEHDSLSWDTPTELRGQLLDIAREGQHDSVLVLSLVDKRVHTDYKPESVSYIPYTREIGAGASVTYMEHSVQPASIERSVDYVIQSTLYDSATGEAVWQALPRTVDPDSLEEAAEGFARVIVDALNTPEREWKKR